MLVSLCVYLHVCVHAHVWAHVYVYVCMNVGVQVPWHTCGGQNTTLVLVLTYLAKKKSYFLVYFWVQG